MGVALVMKCLSKKTKLILVYFLSVERSELEQKIISFVVYGMHVIGMCGW